MYEVMREEPAEFSLDSQWMPIRTGNKKAVSLQVIWQNLTGTLNGRIDVLVTNDTRYSSFLTSFAVDSADNANDAAKLIIDAPFRFLKLEYIPNGITGGDISAIINYE